MLVLIFLAPLAHAADFASDFANTHDRVWLGPEYWANPMEDWRIHQGRLECLSPGLDRNVHLLTRQLGKKPGPFAMSVGLGLLEQGKMPGSAGFRIGIQDEIDDYRARLIYGKGLDAGITTDGTLFIGKVRGEGVVAPQRLKTGVVLFLEGQPVGDGATCTLRISANDPEGKAFAVLAAANIPPEQLSGNIALVNNHTGKSKGKGLGPRFWFSDWNVSGARVEAHDGQTFGPILWSMHTLSRGVLKMTAQLPPVGEKDAQTVRLQVREGDVWKTVAEQKIAPLSYTATFRVEHWDDKRDAPYRLAYTVLKKDGTKSEAHWTGTVRQDPVGKKSVVVAGLSCNADYCFPNLQIVRNLNRQDPDVLFFAGDQIYEYVGGYGIVRATAVDNSPPEQVSRACLNYLRKWYLFGFAFRDLMRDRVTVCIPDDHDVYQGNLWGNGGNPVALARHDAGGYVMHPDFVNCVHRTQSAHLPDPFDPTPIQQGISVYYGDMVYGRVGFAILADRMFKSGPRKVATWPGRPDHLKDPKIDVKTLDKPGLQLLGERQEKFLRHWAADWKGVDMKCVLSQTNFCNVANYHGPEQEYLVADLDSGGWPQSARNRALKEMRKGFAFHLCGDQHLATVVHYGIDQPGDAGFSFTVPAIANFYPRRWVPDEEGKPVKDRPGNNLPNTGDYRDGLGNPVRVYAVGNPEVKYRKGRLASLHDKASGYGLVRFNRADQTITMECYRLLADVADPKKGDQFPGWPMTIHMWENYGRAAAAFLPTVKVKGLTDPVIQVINEKTGEVVYTLRIKGTEFRPWIFDFTLSYTIKVGDPDTGQWRTFQRIVEPAREWGFITATFGEQEKEGKK